MEKTYVNDFRKENPKLHMLYVKWACRHLTIIDRQIRELHELSNLNMLDMIAAMDEQRRKLIRENAAYHDANEILKEIRIGNGHRDEDESDDTAEKLDAEFHKLERDEDDLNS